MLCNNSSNCLQSLKTIDRSCWIWWWAQHQNPCFLIYCSSQSFWLYQEVVLHCCLQNYRCCVCQSDNFWIAHPKGCWHNNLEYKSYPSKKLEALQWKRRNQPLRINQVIIWPTAICKITKIYTSIGVMHLTVLTLNLSCKEEVMWMLGMKLLRSADSRYESQKPCWKKTWLCLSKKAL